MSHLTAAIDVLSRKQFLSMSFLFFTSTTFSIWPGWLSKAWHSVTALLCFEQESEPIWVKNAHCFPFLTFFQDPKPWTVKTSEPPCWVLLLLETKQNRQYAWWLLSEYSSHDGKQLNQWYWKRRWWCCGPEGLYVCSRGCIGPKFKYARLTTSLWLGGYCQICGRFAGSLSKNSIPLNKTCSLFLCTSSSSWFCCSNWNKGGGWVEGSSLTGSWSVLLLLKYASIVFVFPLTMVRYLDNR